MAESTESEKKELQFDTVSVHAGLNRSDDGVKDIPIYASTSFVFNDSAHGAAIFSMNAEAFCYSRIGNPTVDVFEKRMAALEGGAAALATASGEAALFVTITALAQYGSNIVVASNTSEVSAHQFKYRFPPLGIATRFVGDGGLESVRSAIDQNTKAIFVECLSIDGLVVANIESLASIAHENGVPLIVDNTHGAGGYLVRPIDHGADIVVESAAPWVSISGHNQGGIIIDSGKFPWNQSQARFPLLFEPSPGFHGLKMWEKFGKLAFISFARVAVLRDIGPCLNPYEASMLLAGLETLSVRMEKISDSAWKLAAFLEQIESVGEVRYIGLAPYSSNSLNLKYLTRGHGGLLYFTLKETSDYSAVRSRFKIVSIGHSIGGSRTLMITGPNALEEGGKTNETGETNKSLTRVYVSVGLENIDDLKEDFAQALSGI